MSNVIPMELPHQMPPLVIDHFDAPKPAPAAQPLPPVEIPEQPEKLKKADVQLEAAQIAQEIGQQEPQKPEYEFPPVSAPEGRKRPVARRHGGNAAER